MPSNENTGMGSVQVLGAKHIEVLQKNYDWAVTIFDTSKVLTFLVSLGLIVCGSFRAIKMESKGKEDEDGEDNNNNEGLKSFSLQDMHTIESTQAFILPLGASVSLFIMFYFFDNLQLLFIFMTAVLAIVAFSFLLLPICQYLTAPCFKNTNRISLCCFGRFTSAEICSILVSSLIVILWVFTGHWLLMDALAMAFSITMIAFVRLPSLKVSVILLFGLLIYDIFWVFLSEYIFSVNVMVKVATQPAYNPVNYLAKKFNLQETLHVPSQLSLPGKLVFPSSHRTGQFSMLGIGDIVMPGLLLCFVLRYENHKKAQSTTQPTSSVTYFHCSLIGYLVGLFTATLASELTMAAQPALLYLVPFTILPLVIRAYMQGDLKNMWSSPFSSNGVKEQHLEV